MAELVVMKRGEATMNVPPTKAAQFAAEGWEEIDRYAMDTPAVAVETPDESMPDAQKVETPKARKGK